METFMATLKRPGKPIKGLNQIPKIIVKKTIKQNIMELVLKKKKCKLKDFYKFGDEGTVRRGVRYLVAMNKINRRECECGLRNFYEVKK